MNVEGPVKPLPEAAIEALRVARIVPVKAYKGDDIILYDMYIGSSWQGSRRTLSACKYHLNFLLKRIEDDARIVAGEHTPKGVSQGTEGKKHHAGAL